MNDTDRISAFIDVPFYARETDVPFSSTLEAAEHFIKYGQIQGLSPSPFILWGWISAENRGMRGFGDFLLDPLRFCAHPAMNQDIYRNLLLEIKGDMVVLDKVLSKSSLDNNILLPKLVLAGQELGYQNLRSFLASLSELKTSRPILELESFSSTWYLENYDDVRDAGANPFRHYVVSGWREGRDPSPRFSTNSYLVDHPDVKESGQNPLIHFLRIGESEGRVRRSSTAFFPIVRHQTRSSTLPAQYVPFESEDDDAILQICSEIPNSQVVIIVPFYKNEELVPLVCGSLCRCADELSSHNAAVILVNDSPEYTELVQPLQQWADKLSHEGVSVALFESTQNRGFIYSSNIGFKCADILEAYCLMLNSDAELQPGSLSEMLYVASLDDRFAFVNPMSNNATIATFGLDTTPDAASSARRHANISEWLPRYMIVPTCVGFCLLIKPEVIRLFGFLDRAYGKGYNEENDYIMRANRKGYVSVIASRAFVAHIGEQSFSSMSHGREAREARNRALLLERYPEFSIATENYFNSLEAQVRRITERYGDAIDVVIDASSLPGIPNGTSVLAQELIHRIVKKIGVERCAIRTSAENLERLGLTDVVNLKWLKTGEECYSKIAFRLSQPYHKQEIVSLSSHAAKTVFFMLDTISDDCLYLRDRKVHNLWEWVAEYADAVIYNSDYTMDKFQKRFSFNAHVIQSTSYHSLNIRDYAAKHRVVEDRSTSGTISYLLIIGNYYQHKAVGMALDATENLGLHRVLIGAKIDRYNLVSFESGSLTSNEVAMLYNNATIILFPSLYEGFGFPLMEGIASKKPIVVHDNDLSRYIVDRVGSPSSVSFFKTFSEIGSCVRSAMMLQSEPITETSEDGWERSVEEIVAVLDKVKEMDISYNRIVRREKSISGLM